MQSLPKSYRETNIARPGIVGQKLKNLIKGHTTSNVNQSFVLDKDKTPLLFSPEPDSSKQDRNHNVLSSADYGIMGLQHQNSSKMATQRKTAEEEEQDEWAAI